MELFSKGKKGDSRIKNNFSNWHKKKQLARI
jgi:hypothetical protein